MRERGAEYALYNGAVLVLNDNVFTAITLHNEDRVWRPPEQGVAHLLELRAVRRWSRPNNMRTFSASISRRCLTVSVGLRRMELKRMSFDGKYTDTVTGRCFGAGANSFIYLPGVSVDSHQNRTLRYVAECQR